jgi:pyruvate dehydrogenase E2 component (dihydrolipoamide acetyltransferase)
MGQSWKSIIPSFIAKDIQVDNLASRLLALTQKSGFVLRLNDLVVTAAAKTLRQFPTFNGFEWNDHTALYEPVHIGIAVDFDGVLIVPVLRHADRLSLKDMAEESTRLQMKMVKKELTPEDYLGSTFTVTNLAGAGIQMFVPVIQEYQAAILAVGATVQRPVQQDGQWVASDAMTLGLSFNHRLNNGMQAAQFLNAVADQLLGLLHG